MSKKVYLAGAMGCYEKDDNYPYFWRNNVRQWLESYTNFRCFSPCDYYNYTIQAQKTEKEVMKYEFHQLKNSDVMLVNLRDLDKSIGSSDEILFAYLNNIPIIGFLEKENIDEIHPWKIEQIDRIEFGEDAMMNALYYINEYYG